MDDYIPPKFLLDGFNCPHCGAFAHQTWHNTMSNEIQHHQTNFIQDSQISICFKCGNAAYWIKKDMVYPLLSIAPLPPNDMPDDVKKIYIEARNVLNSSPRAAAALLRLAIELLMPHLNAEGNDLNAKIHFLVKNGLDPKISMALDSVRVIGNHAVHPGLIEIDDDNSLALKLFSLINIIIDSTITKDRRIEELHKLIPEKERTAIERRDK